MKKKFGFGSFFTSNFIGFQNGFFYLFLEDKKIVIQKIFGKKITIPYKSIKNASIAIWPIGGLFKINFIENKKEKSISLRKGPLNKNDLGELSKELRNKIKKVEEKKGFFFEIKN